VLRAFAPSLTRRVGSQAGHVIMTNTALTGATYDIDGGQQFTA